MKFYRWFLVGTAAALTISCRPGGGAEQGRVETVVDTVGGVAHVRNSGDPPVWRLEPVLRLGTVEGGPQEFGRIRSLIADAQGNIYVADNLAHEVRVFSPEGHHLRSIGRQGGGPGEFGDLYSLAWLNGQLAAMDPGNARISILSERGEWIDGIRYFPITGPASLIRLHPLGENGFYAPAIDVQRQGLPFVRFTTAGPADTIANPQRAEGVRQTGVVCQHPGGITAISLPEAPGIAFGFPPPGGAVAVSWTEDYRIAFLDPRGDTLRVVARERPPLPYPDSLWEEGMRPYHELRENFPGARCEPATPERPRHRAALRHLLFDEAGRMWVETASEEGFAWEVFDPEGRLLGAVPAPPRAAGIPPYVRNGHLYQVETDELDVQYVAVYRITEGVR